jgi:hypothetical protein
MSRASPVSKCARRHRRGFALPAAIIALVLLSVLVAGALFLSTEELRAGRTDVAAQRALSAAEWGLDRTVASWDAQLNTRLQIGDSRVLLEWGEGSDSVEVAALRVQEHAFWITSHATSGADGRAIPARTTIGASMRLVVPRSAVRAALTAAGAVTVDGGTVDGGEMRAPADATGVCAALAAVGVAGIIVPDSSRVCGASCTGSPVAGVFGAPPVATDSSLASDSTTLLGAREAFAARVSASLPGGELSPAPVVVGNDCLRTSVLNWGDPTSGGPCADHYPVVHVRGDAVLAAGAVGQGVLLVDGTLQLGAGARFFGLVIVANDVVVGEPGAEITGAVIAGDVDRGEGSRVAAGGAIRFAACAVRRALLGAARLTRTPDRWWAELR